MAYVQRSGGRYTVRQGNTGKVLRTVSTESKAREVVRELHQKNNPLPRNRGAAAARRNR